MFFARQRGAPVTITQPQAASQPELPQLKDPRDVGATNDLVVVFNYDNTELIRPLLGAAAKGRALPPPALEAAVIAAVNRKEAGLTQSLLGPTQARYLMAADRMSDADREIAAEYQSPREYLDRYIILRYPSVGAARAAQKKLAANELIKSVVMNADTLQSMLPNDPYFQPATNAPGNTSWYQWGMYAMNFPGAWDRVRGHAQIGLIEFGFPGAYRSSASLGPYGGFVTHPQLVESYRSHFMPGVPFTGINPTGSEMDANHATHVAGIISAKQGDGVGVSGGCDTCSVTSYPYSNGLNNLFQPNPTQSSCSHCSRGGHGHANPQLEWVL